MATCTGSALGAWPGAMMPCGTSNACRVSLIWSTISWRCPKIRMRLPCATTAMLNQANITVLPEPVGEARRTRRTRRSASRMRRTQSSW